LHLEENLMNSPTAIHVIRWLIGDTFRQARASGILWLMLAISGLCIFFCLSISVSGGTSIYPRGETREFLPAGDPGLQKNLEKDPQALKRHGLDVPQGNLYLLFGAFRISYEHYREEVIYFLELLLAGLVADTGGILLVLIWTAAFLPTFLESGKVSVLLVKSVPRWLLLLGKYLGVVCFVFFQALLFVGGTWLALALKTGVWAPTYLLCIPLLVVQFAIFFSFSLLLAVFLRGTLACVLGSTLFWFACWGVNYSRNVSLLGSSEETSPLRVGGEILYWVLPKPMDMSLIVFDALRAGNYFARALNVESLAKSGTYSPELSVLTSLLFAALMLGLAAYRFERTDY